MLMTLIMTLSVVSVGNAPSVMAGVDFRNGTNIAENEGNTQNAGVIINGLTDGKIESGMVFTGAFELAFSSFTQAELIQPYYTNPLTMYVPVPASVTDFRITEDESKAAFVKISPDGEYDALKAAILSGLAEAHGSDIWNADGNYVWHVYSLVTAAQADTGDSSVDLAAPGKKINYSFTAKFPNGTTPDGAKASFGYYIMGEAGGTGGDMDKTPVSGLPIYTISYPEMATAIAETKYDIEKAVTNADMSKTEVETLFGEGTYGKEWVYVSYTIEADHADNFISGKANVINGANGMIALDMTYAPDITDTFATQSDIESGKVALVGVASDGTALAVTSDGGTFTVPAATEEIDGNTYMAKTVYTVVVKYNKADYPAPDDEPDFSHPLAEQGYTSDASGDYYKTVDGPNWLVDNKATLAYTQITDAHTVEIDVNADTTFAFVEKPETFSVAVAKYIVLPGTSTPVPYTAAIMEQYPVSAGGIKFTLVDDKGATVKNLYGQDATATLTATGFTAESGVIAVAADGLSFSFVDIEGTRFPTTTILRKKAASPVGRQPQTCR